MYRLLMGVVVTWFVVGCGCTDDETVPNAAITADSPAANLDEDEAVTPGESDLVDWDGPINTEAEARQALLAHNQTLGRFNPEEAEQWHVSQTTYSSALKGLERTLREDEMQNAVVYGTVEDLRQGQDGEVWWIMEMKGFDTKIAILDAQSGEVVLVWYPPEG